MTLPKLDVTVQDSADIEDVVIESKNRSLRDSIKDAVVSFGGKAALFSMMANTKGIPMPKAFAVPIFFVKQARPHPGRGTTEE